MSQEYIEVTWPDGQSTYELVGSSWLEMASKRNFEIPTGCLLGSCGACEIEVNGEVIRACVSTLKMDENHSVNVSLAEDPYW